MTINGAGSIPDLTVSLEAGAANYMGDGLFVVCQRDEDTSEMQDVVLSVQDLKVIGASQDRTVPLEDGVAEHVGDDLWVVYQTDGGLQQSVVITGQDCTALLAFAA